MFTPQVIFMTVLMFFVLVGIHEWGHYYFAKRAGILVREFAIGFGPKLLSYKKGETRFTFRLLPFGGFARMAGEDPEVIQINPGQTIAVKINNNQVTRLFVDQLDTRTDVIQGVVESIDMVHALTLRLSVDGESESYTIHPQAILVARGTETQIAPWDRQFGSKKVGKRSLTIFAGPMMNFILAFVLFLLYAWVSGVPEHVKLGKVIDHSPAQQAELQVGDLVLSVDGQEIGTDRDQFRKLISQSANKEMLWTIQRDQETKIVKVTPKDEKGQGMVGIEIRLSTREASFGEVLKNGTLMTGDFTKQIFVGLQKLVTMQVKMDDLGGPVRIVEVTGQAANMGFSYLILWTAALSLYLGIFNLLPFPALDGSRLIFLGIEALRGKPVDPNRESMVHFIGFAMLMLLMIAVTYNDILRLFKG